jgi:hypothetical protein
MTGVSPPREAPQPPRGRIQRIYGRMGIRGTSGGEPCREVLSSQTMSLFYKSTVEAAPSSNSALRVQPSTPHRPPSWTHPSKEDAPSAETVGGLFGQSVVLCGPLLVPSPQCPDPALCTLPAVVDSHTKEDAPTLETVGWICGQSAVPGRSEPGRKILQIFGSESPSIGRAFCSACCLATLLCALFLPSSTHTPEEHAPTLETVGWIHAHRVVPSFSTLLSVQWPSASSVSFPMRLVQTLLSCPQILSALTHTPQEDAPTLETVDRISALVALFGLGVCMPVSGVCLVPTLPSLLQIFPSSTHTPQEDAPTLETVGKICAEIALFPAFAVQGA